MNTDPNNSVLDLRNVSKSFPFRDSEVSVLREISLSLPAGESLALVGPSGSGKTTLLGISAGLEQASGGSIHLCGKEISKQSENQLAKLRADLIGFVFQSFRLIPTLTALENVALPLEMKGERGAEKDAATLLERVGLSHRFDHYPKQLSGGEQQRVALARAFINRPRVLFADEPTGNLDQENSETVTSLLFELNREAQTSLVLATHDLELAERIGNVIRLRGGQIET